MLNGDFYLKKKKRVEEQIKENSKKEVKKKPTKTNRTQSKKTVTKNSDLIFGK